MKVLSHNRKARYDYDIHHSLEAGIVLIGSEAKSLRSNRASLDDSFVIVSDGELFLHNAHIAEYAPAKIFGHQPKRQRKLLLHKREIKKIIGQMSKKGMTVVPTKIYINDKGKIKIEIAVASGRNKIDKREAIKERDWKRQKQGLFKVYQREK
ncbi:SsrA-binding protein SmpB [Candidatus Hydrogenosomobacter endosymbioticus]|uniref:SsrA-binding protein n=1 Tax=Candidatus Hydrogenosomobacter endosymbioticus TaxID=2558174 RepID=A0ABN6L342_9PROT|nr:SsrA-binding protein SmpB [Candidatus Hydrogenosomobacter endosymbioticus]BDB96281.1 SsrA-binding protein [Candidatus Hydrogenosomobacter endosymbioticus]